LFRVTTAVNWASAPIETDSEVGVMATLFTVLEEPLPQPARYRMAATVKTPRATLRVDFPTPPGPAKWARGEFNACSQGAIMVRWAPDSLACLGIPGICSGSLYSMLHKKGSNFAL
jgi:hypothetical protein